MEAAEALMLQRWQGCGGAAGASQPPAGGARGLQKSCSFKLLLFSLLLFSYATTMQGLGLLVALAGSAHALTLPTHFASSMVLQRDAPILFWGLDTPGATVTVTYRGLPQPPAVADATGRFSLTLPALPKNATPCSLLVRSSLGPELALMDILLGDVFVCSGQSNQAIPVAWSLYYNDTLAQSDALGSRLRLLQVAALGSYVDTTTPQDNFTASIPWSRASPLTAAPFSALCYHFGAQVAQAYPDLPVGLLANAWGGVAIEVYMSPAALAACAATPPREAPPPAHRAVLNALTALEAAMHGAAAPVKPSCLYNAMMHPILSIPVTAFLWYR
jgi:sialate O-acetylesterase